MTTGRKKHQLDPIDIPLMFPRIEDDLERADGGVGRLHVTRDLVVYVTYPFDVSVGTTFQLIWQGAAPVGFYLVREGDLPRTRYPLTVPSNVIRERWADPVYCKIIPSNDEPQQTPPLRLRVNLQRPGGKAPEPTEEGHRGLVFDLEPEVALEGVDETKAKQGVVVTCRKWENMAVYDLLTLTWGSQRINHLVLLDEVDKDINITVKPEIISAAGDNKMLPVGMTVTGPTGNLPDENARWSVISHVPVHAQSRRMDSPWIDKPATESRIDLAEIGNDAVRIGIHVNSDNYERYTHIHFFWIGTPAEGGPIAHSETREITGARSHYFEVPNGLLSAIAKGSAITYYTLDSPDEDSDRSNYRHMTVDGEIIQWMPPTVESDSDGQVDPDLPKVEIYIPIQPGWQSFEALDLTLLASGVGGTIEHHIGIDLGELPPGQEQLTVVLEGDDLKRFKGRLAELFYSATKNGERPRESLRRSLRIGDLQPDMSAPVVQDERDGELHLDKVSPFGTPIHAPFSDVEFGNWITLCIKGVHSVDLPKQVNIGGVAVSFDVLPQDLTPNRGEDTSIYYTLKRGSLPERYSLTTPLHIV